MECVCNRGATSFICPSYHENQKLPENFTSGLLFVILARDLGFPYSSVSKESACSVGDPDLILRSGRSPGEGLGYPLQYSWASLLAQLVKEPACNEGDLGSIPGLGKSPGEGKSYPLQYSGLETVHGVHGVAKSRTLLSHFHFKPYWSFCIQLRYHILGEGSLV